MGLKRIPIPQNTQEKLRNINLNVCCVCKERGIGINFHHIDGNPANNDEDNIAVLCVQEHDQHHRPKAYDQTKHIELGADKIREYKRDWEQTVKEGKSDNPKILAVINAFGDFEKIHSVKLVIQNIDRKIIFERLYHQHKGTMDEWTDEIMEEVEWVGKKIPLTLIGKPISIELCPCCSNSFTTVLDNNVAIRLTSKDWNKKSIGTIYIKPKTTSFDLTIFYGEQRLYDANIHKCANKYLHFHSDKYDERVLIKKNVSVRTQAKDLLQKVLDVWKPGLVFIGTGDPNKPIIIDEFKLPRTWEKRN